MNIPIKFAPSEKLDWLSLKVVSNPAQQPASTFGARKIATPSRPRPGLLRHPRERQEPLRRPGNIRAGFTLAKALVAMAVGGISLIGLYSGLGQGDKMADTRRQNSRALQMMAQEMETLRLCTWDQLTNNGHVPAGGTHPFYPASVTSQNFDGITYHETLTIANSPLKEGYSSDVREVILTVTWNSPSGQHQRQMTTLVSRYGMKNCLYNMEEAQ